MRRKLHNLVQELRGNIRVFARCRPFLPSDGGSNGSTTVITNIETNSIRVCRTSEDNKIEETQFQFDKVCMYIYTSYVAYITCTY